MAVLFELLIVALLILFNGFFSMAEFALVSVRRIRLQQMVEKGEKGAASALKLSEEPNTFLSTIQIGITLIGILTGAFGGAAIAVQMAGYVTPIPVIGDFSETISLLLVVLVITFFTLVFGELVPKRVGMAYPEKTAVLVAGPIQVISRFLAPLNHLASRVTEGVLWFFGSYNMRESSITEEDITTLLEEGTQAGIFDEAEQELVQSAFRFGDREVTTLMAPRPEVVFLDLDDSFNDNREKILATGHTRYPVCKGGLDSILGVISVRDLWSQANSGREQDLTSLVQEALVIPEHISAIRLLELFRTAKTPLAIIMDEYGSVAGIITLHDLLEAIVGDLSTVDQQEHEPSVIQREDGSLLVDGMLPIEDLRNLLEIKIFPGEEEGYYRTAAGFIMNELGRIPVTGDRILFGNYRFEVVDMDKRRIDKLMICRINVGLNDTNDGVSGISE